MGQGQQFDMNGFELELEVATLVQSGPEWEARGQAAASRWRRQNGGGHSTGNAALNT